MSGRPCVFGEALFDHFANGRRVLGGAPFNVAWHLRAFGEDPYFLSRVGEDEEGLAVRAAMEGWGMDTGGLQTDAQLPTGRVEVRIEDGEPAYDIVYPAAWDAIGPAGPQMDARLLYHGSLALRSETSRRTWRQLREAKPGLIFVDVNLRQPWWQRDQVLQDLDGAHWVKLNHQELDLLAPDLRGVRARARDFLRRYRLHGLLLTDGSRGAEILTAGGEEFAVRPAEGVPVADTVGAGDSLAAVMILGLLRGWPLGVSLQRAQSFASAVVGRHGATVSDPDFYRYFIDDWANGSPVVS